MTYASVCSGIEAASCAWHPLGWKAAFFAEIDRFPCAVLNHRWPRIPNYGDFTKIRDAGRIDVLVGGTPCQSFSVAGKRGGLDDPRGVLAFEFLKLAGRLRSRWVLFENVAGLLSSDEGRDFGAFLGALGKLGYGFCWRVLDAQYFGVAQRRERVFVVGYSGNPGRLAEKASREDLRRFSLVSAAVLLERQSLSGDSAPRRTAREDVAGSLGGGSGSRGWCDDLDRAGAFIDVSPTILAGGNRTGGHRPPGTDVDTCETLIAHSLRADGFDASEDGTGRIPIIGVDCYNGAFTGETTGALRRGNGNSMGGVPAVAIHENQRAEVSLSDTVGTLKSGGGKPGQGYPAIGFYANDNGRDAAEELCPTLRSMDGGGGNHPAIAFIERTRTDGRNLEYQEDVAYALTNPGSGGRTHSRQIMSGMQVRRLTPVEAERLQGFADDYTLVPYRGKLAADGPRYKAIGNSMAVPVMSWIGRRIEAVEQLIQIPKEAA